MKLSKAAYLSSEKIDANQLTTNNYLSTDNMLPNIGGFTKSNQLPKGTVAHFVADDILLSNIRPYFKKMVFSTFEGGASNDVLCIRVNKASVLPKYLFYCLSSDSFFSYYNANCKGTKMPRGDKQALLNYDFPFRELSEQHHIVNTISSLLLKSL